MYNITKKEQKLCFEFYFQFTSSSHRNIKKSGTRVTWRERQHIWLMTPPALALGGCYIFPLMFPLHWQKYQTKSKCISLNQGKSAQKFCEALQTPLFNTSYWLRVWTWLQMKCTFFFLSHSPTQMFFKAMWNKSKFIVLYCNKTTLLFNINAARVIIRFFFELKETISILWECTPSPLSPCTLDYISKTPSRECKVMTACKISLLQSAKRSGEVKNINQTAWPLVTSPPGCHIAFVIQSINRWRKTSVAH